MRYLEENYDLQTERNDRNRDWFCSTDRWISRKIDQLARNQRLGILIENVGGVNSRFCVSFSQQSRAVISQIIEGEAFPFAKHHAASLSRNIAVGIIIDQVWWGKYIILRKLRNYLEKFYKVMKGILRLLEQKVTAFRGLSKNLCSQRITNKQDTLKSIKLYDFIIPLLSKTVKKSKILSIINSLAIRSYFPNSYTENTQ